MMLTHSQHFQQAPPTDDEDEGDDDDDNKSSTFSLAPKGPQHLPRELRRLFSPPGGLRTGGILALPPLLPPPLPAPGAAAMATAASQQQQEVGDDEDDEKESGDNHTLALAAPGAGKRRAFFAEVIGELGRVHVTARDEAARAAKARARKRKQRREVGFVFCVVCWGVVVVVDGMLMED